MHCKSETNKFQGEHKIKNESITDNFFKCIGNEWGFGKKTVNAFLSKILKGYRGLLIFRVLIIHFDICSIHFLT